MDPAPFEQIGVRTGDQAVVRDAERALQLGQLRPLGRGSARAGDERLQLDEVAEPGDAVEVDADALVEQHAPLLLDDGSDAERVGERVGQRDVVRDRDRDRDRGGRDRDDRQGGERASRDDVAAHGRDEAFKPTIRIVTAEDAKERRERERAEKAEKEAKRQAERDRLSKFGY